MASGQTLIVWTAEGARLGSGTPGALDTRNNHPVVDLTTGDEVTFGFVLPRHYAGGGITVNLHYAMLSATTNNVKYTTAFERIGNGTQSIASDNFATGIGGADQTVPGTSGLVKIYTNTHTDGTQINSIAVGEYGRLKVTRSVPVGTDSTSDSQLVCVELKET